MAETKRSTAKEPPPKFGITNYYCPAAFLADEYERLTALHVSLDTTDGDQRELDSVFNRMHRVREAVAGFPAQSARGAAFQLTVGASWIDSLLGGDFLAPEGDKSDDERRHELLEGAMFCIVSALRFYGSDFPRGRESPWPEAFDVRVLGEVPAS